MTAIGMTAVHVVTVALLAGPAALAVGNSSVPDLDTLVSLTSGETDLMNQALDHLMSQCMGARGFAHRSTGGGAQELHTGPPTETELEQYGYEFFQQRLEALNGPPEAPLPPAEEAARNECGEGAADEIGLVDFNLVRQSFANAAAEIRIRAEADPRYLDGVTVWSACMRDLGYEVEAPGDALALASGSEGGLGSDFARQLAVLDYSCRSQAQLGELRREVVAELTRAWLDSHPDALAQFDLAKSNFLARCANTLEDVP